MILVIAAITAALVVSDLPAEVATNTKAAVCKATGGTDCYAPGGKGAGNGTGDGTGQPPGGSTGNGNQSTPPRPQGPTDADTAYQQAREDQEAAEREAGAAEDEFGNLRKELLDLAKSLIGLDDLEKCITEGDIAACLWTLASALPLGKALKFIKLIPKLAKFLLRAKKALDRINSARKRRQRAQAALRKAAEACRVNSFTPRTRVLMADGSRRPIVDVDVGDRVWAADPATGLAGGWPVTALIAGAGAKAMVEVTVDPDGVLGGPTETVTATDGHPFWVASEARWVEAGDLIVGDALSTPAGVHPMVVGTRAYTRRQRVHNLSVAGTHTYYVAAGASDLLVHNCPKKLTSAIDRDPLLVRAAERAGRSVQKEIDHLTSELAKGNLNPGIGTKALQGTGLSYARGRNGARVFFRETKDGIEIVGKADKNNEQQVINRLIELYGQ